MTLNQLIYALNVAKHASFKKAGEKLQVSQPALSVQIQKLEEEVGIRIFDRSTTPITSTNDGRLFLERRRRL